MQRRFLYRKVLTSSFVLSSVAASLFGCAKPDSGSNSNPSAKPIANYCPYVAAPATFASSVTVSGKALFEFRKDGNGLVSTGVHTLTPNGVVGTYDVTINGTAFSAASVAGLSTAINNDLVLLVTASIDGSGRLVLTPDVAGDPITLSALGRFSATARDNPKPIRRAEVIVTDASGNIAQCSETDGNGDFSFVLPANSGTYTISVASRASNNFNSAYILNNPTDNQYHKISTTVNSAANSSGIRLLARATGTLEGGAFNILDQILVSQEYLRQQTLNCNVGGAINYYPGCQPFTLAPIVHVYWTPGFNPGTYVGLQDGISFYLNDRRQLYILGGLNGDVSSSDTDHFDNSVIIHEYAHFLEDEYGNPDSPGGSHNGNSIIDPRLAWGEGWANFFQAAALNNPLYRDTYGNVDCGSSSCYGVSFNENLDPTGPTYSDKPAAGPTGMEHGEGNFREFSVTRLLWDTIKGRLDRGFAEIWTPFAGSTSFKNSSDRFKSIGRLHVLQQANTGKTDWSTYRTDERQVGSLSVYATPLNVSASCTPSTVTLPITVSGSDDGSFAKSDHFRNNDFYYYNHPGGTLSVGLTWSGASTVDLDVYVYKQGYVFGNRKDALMYVDTENKGMSGSESVSASLAAGNYIINIMAYTGPTVYAYPGFYPTDYVLRINGTTACPNP